MRLHVISTLFSVSIGSRRRVVVNSATADEAFVALNQLVRSKLSSSFQKAAAIDRLPQLANVLLAPSPTPARRSHEGRNTNPQPQTSMHVKRPPPSMAASGLDLDIGLVKSKILQISALTDRGQRLNKLVAPTYQEKRKEMAHLVGCLANSSAKAAPSKDLLAGEWELVYSDVELFRSSPFFLAIEEALNSSPGIPTLGRWLGATDPKKKAEVFFKLHQLQVLSWGLSTVGRIGQKLDFEKGVLESTFDTTIFGLTVIPILGWFKLLPTFGGRVVTEADRLTLQEDGTMCMELQRTQVITAPGVPRIPLVDSIFMDRWYPVNAVWKLLPWNGGPFEGRAPSCSIKVEYVDEHMRISRDAAGAIFVYTRPL